MKSNEKYVSYDLVKSIPRRNPNLNSNVKVS